MKLFSVFDGSSKPCRFDRNKHEGGVMVYIRDKVPSKILEKHSCPNNIECLFKELNFRKCKWKYNIYLQNANTLPSVSSAITKL